MACVCVCVCVYVMCKGRVRGVREERAAGSRPPASLDQRWIQLRQRASGDDGAVYRHDVRRVANVRLAYHSQPRTIQMFFVIILVFIGFVASERFLA